MSRETTRRVCGRVPLYRACTARLSVRVTVTVTVVLRLPGRCSLVLYFFFGDEGRCLPQWGASALFVQVDFKFSASRALLSEGDGACMAGVALFQATASHGLTVAGTSESPLPVRTVPAPAWGAPSSVLPARDARLLAVIPDYHWQAPA